MAIGLTLEILVGGVPVTTYAYHEGLVTLSPHSGVEISPAELRGNLRTIDRWITAIGRLDTIVPSTRGDFTEEVKRDGDKVEGIFRAESVLVTEVEQRDGEAVEFAARPEVTLSWPCFRAWVAFLWRFYGELRV